MEEHSDDIVIDLREIFGKLRQRWRQVAGVVCFFGAAAVAYCFMAAPVYESTMTLQVRQPRNLKSDMMDFTSESRNKDYV